MSPCELALQKRKKRERRVWAGHAIFRDCSPSRSLLVVVSSRHHSVVVVVVAFFFFLNLTTHLHHTK